ncbi:Homogentisate 1,2-dioxygenase [Camellia lanceoleosa]|uniref:Homogentisate 1,2-dioxygenase n=1 Tax=Camellia lanceoleosa TaxID=1840588 RepID=A0ACC0FYV3_9ERIC|nr:Homogentisate 1,2-dioxygenase [Camellia lanceoleosa]
MVHCLYRFKPSVTHDPFNPQVPSHEKLVSEFNQSNSSAIPTQLRCKPVEIPDKPTDFIDGLYAVCGAGSSCLQHGFAIHVYTANKSMDNRSSCNTDGDFLIVPQKGRLWIRTECGRLQVCPGEIVLLPQGFYFPANLLQLVLHHRSASWAQGTLHCLSLVECLRISDSGLKRVLECNAGLTKLNVPGYVSLSVEGILCNYMALFP